MKVRFTGIDFGREDEDYTSWFSGYKNRNGEIVIDREGYKKVRKEVKKVRPYLEVKVVKVKKEKKEMYCPCCGSKIEKEKPKGNWINGENIDKIKFPVPCSYVDGGKKHIGMLNKYCQWYRLYIIENQSNDNFIDDCTSLENLIRDYNIHILKGKIILFEEEK